MFNNSTNYTGPNFNWEALKYSYYSLYSFVIVFGTMINAWMLGSLMTSPEMRSSMRNRLVCLILFNNIVRVILVCFLEILQLVLAIEHGILTPCGFGTFVRIMRFSLMWNENWYVLIVMVHYISTLLEFDPRKYLSERKLQIGTILILAGPWVISFIVGPAVLAHESHRRYGQHSEGCVYYTFTAFKSLGNFGIVAPWFIKMGLIVLILVLNYRRRTQYSTMNTSLVAAPTHIDDVKAYVVLYLIVAVTQALFVIRFLWRFRISDLETSIAVSYLTWFLVEFRCAIIPFAFLFLEDIRTRTKTWKPWYRPAPGIDLTVQYNQTKDEHAS